MNLSHINETAFDLFIRNNLQYFHLISYILYTLIFLFGILGNSVVIYVLMSSIFVNRNQKNRALILKEHTTIINAPNNVNNSFKYPLDAPRKSINLEHNKFKLSNLISRFLKEKLTVTNFYLLNLAITDFFYVLFIPILLCTMVKRKWLFGSFFCKFYFSMVYLCQCSSVFILVVLSIDRFLSVKYPLKTSTFRSDQIARIVILMSWLLSFLFIIPVILQSEYQIQDSSCQLHWPVNWSFPKPNKFALFANTYLTPLQLFNIYTFLLNYLIPVSIIVILYTQILSSLEKNSQKNTARSKQKKKSHRHITKMVLAIIICYLTCWTPYWTFQIFLYIIEIIGMEAPSFLIIVSHFVQVVAYMSSALNPFIYSYMSEAFRANLNEALGNCCCWRKKDFISLELKEIRKDSLIKKEVENQESNKKLGSTSTVRIESVSSLSNPNDKEVINKDPDCIHVIKEENKNLLDENLELVGKRRRSRHKCMSFSTTQPEPDPEPMPLERQSNSANNLEANKKIPIKKLTLLNTSNSKLKLEINFHGFNYFKK
ncbi:unnamed protein product [Brachionus calyciflorus]|uniref:G-protein coupled receptors family 1 profile domain-containing protein n=1 Tax=Brachionus calyciflorus TaxID=104777 RepID=A0A813MTW9_9BILA|nr:unnamed protein product [Brachionus calyciflorus]